MWGYTPDPGNKSGRGTVALLYMEMFLALLVAYLVSSEWSGIDSRYPIAMALIVLLAAVVVAAVGDTSVANALAGFVFFLLAGGVLLMVVDHVRDARPSPAFSQRP